MAVRQLTYLGNPVLREKAKKVKIVDKSVARLIDDMVETMNANNGLGLAANQVGVLQRVIVVEAPEDEDDPQTGKLYAVVNPEIIKASDVIVTIEEGCLSIPYYYGEVARAETVVVKGKDRKGHDFRIKAGGMLARAFQHEVDHLDGVLFIDRMESTATLRYVPPRPAGEGDEEAEAGEASGDQQREREPVFG